MAPSRGSAAPTPSATGVSPGFLRLLDGEDLAARTVLDVGTGRGRLALLLAPRCGRVVGIDRDEAALADARRAAEAAGVRNVEFVALDAEAGEYTGLGPEAVVAHLCMSAAIAERAGRALTRGALFAFVAFHADQWQETGRRSRFAWDEDETRRVLASAGFAVEALAVERDVQRFASVEEALAAAIGLEERWRADGRWFRYIKFLEEGGRTLTRAHLHVRARKT